MRYHQGYRPLDGLVTPGVGRPLDTHREERGQLAAPHAGTAAAALILQRHRVAAVGIPGQPVVETAPAYPQALRNMDDGPALRHLQEGQGTPMQPHSWSGPHLGLQTTAPARVRESLLMADLSFQGTMRRL